MLDSAVRFRLHFPLRGQFQPTILHVQADGSKTQLEIHAGCAAIERKPENSPGSQRPLRGTGAANRAEIGSRGDGIASQRAGRDASLASVAKASIDSSVSSSFDPWVGGPDSSDYEREAKVEHS